MFDPRADHVARNIVLLTETLSEAQARQVRAIADDVLRPLLCLQDDALSASRLLRQCAQVVHRRERGRCPGQASDDGEYDAYDAGDASARRTTSLENTVRLPAKYRQPSPARPRPPPADGPAYRSRQFRARERQF